MSSILSVTELRKMQMKDLLRELREQAALVAKLRLGIKMKKEKNSGKYRHEKKQISRMQTVLTEKVYEAYEEKESPSPKKS